MSLEDVKEEIVRKAKQESEKIKKESDKERTVILDDARSKAEKITQEAIIGIEAELKAMQKRGDAARDLELKKSLLTEKKRLIDETIARVKGLLMDMPDADRKKILEKLIRKARSEIDADKIFCAQRDCVLIDGAREDASISGGIRVESKGGETMIDLSFDTLLDEYKEKNIEDISRMLFG